MTPKEKAKWLCDAMEGACCRCPHDSKNAALIAVDELIKEQDMWQNGQIDPVKYWQEVKKEIELIIKTFLLSSS